MENSSVTVFHSFAVTTVIMPYYGLAHEGFLLLSSISTTSRLKLNKHYNEFRRAIRKHRMLLKVNDISSKLFLPADLFTFSVWLANQSHAEDFVRLVTSLSERRGHYFENHFMHEQLCLHKLYFDSHLVDILNSWVELMKSIKVTKVNDMHEENSQEWTLLDSSIYYFL